MLTPSRSSHRQYVDTAYSLDDLPPFSLPKSLGKEGEFMHLQKGISQLEASRAGFIGTKFAYIVASKL